MTNLVLSSEAQVAINAAKLGGQVALKYFNTNLKVSYKSDATPVTVADTETEKEIRKIITKAYPNAKFVGEEVGGDLSDGEYWIIDPIDGTKQYVRGIPQWAVLIALIKNYEIVLGLCYWPNNGDLMLAEKGKGTYLNNEKVSVSDLKELDNAYLCYGGISHFQEKKGLLKLADTCNTARGFDSSYSYFLTACGKADIVLDSYGVLWDIAPFKLIIEEVGGKVTNLKGGPWTFEDRGAIATNGLLHDEVVKIMNT